MFYSNVHTHSTFCDGKDSLAVIAQQALELGFTDLGFSSHSPAAFDPSCPGVANEAAYQHAVGQLKSKLAGQLTIACGLEYDFYSPPPAAGYDYLIGSVHYFPPRNGVYRSVDLSPADLAETLAEWYQGDKLALIRDYYETVEAHVIKNRPKIVGHYDLISKFNQKAPWFSESEPAYQKCALTVLANIVDELVKYDGLVEINTGAIARAWRDAPYPAPFLLKYLQERGCPVIITSDSHEARTLAGSFSETAALLKAVGFHSSMQLKDGHFQERPLAAD